MHNTHTFSFASAMTPAKDWCRRHSPRPIINRIGSENDLQHALWLVRPYLGYALKNTGNSRDLLESESGRLYLGPRFKSLFQSFLAKSAKQASAESMPAERNRTQT
jgi:hypothetical protein